MKAVLDGDVALAKPGVVEEEVFRRGPGEEQANGLGVDKQVEAQLRGALGAKATGGAGAIGVIERGDGVERAAAGFTFSIQRQFYAGFLVETGMGGTSQPRWASLTVL